MIIEIADLTGLNSLPYYCYSPLLFQIVCSEYLYSEYLYSCSRRCLIDCKYFSTCSGSLQYAAFAPNCTKQLSIPFNKQSTARLLFISNRFNKFFFRKNTALTIRSIYASIQTTKTTSSPDITFSRCPRVSALRNARFGHCPNCTSSHIPLLYSANYVSFDLCSSDRRLGYHIT